MVIAETRPNFVGKSVIREKLVPQRTADANEVFHHHARCDSDQNEQSPIMQDRAAGVCGLRPCGPRPCGAVLDDAAANR